MMQNFLLFRIGERLFGVRLQGAVEIVPWRRPRPVPLSYTYVEGVNDYRGTIYPVFNLAQLLGLSHQAPIGFTAPDGDMGKSGSSIILLRESDRSFGVTVDAVVKMAKLDDAPDEKIEVKGLDTQLVKGVRYDDDQEIILLSFERLFYAG
jgi:purine-binding chemotaxis protein CheW